MITDSICYLVTTHDADVDLVSLGHRKTKLAQGTSLQSQIRAGVG